MNKNSKIYVAGHIGLVGSAIVRNLKKRGFNNLLLKDLSELDLIDQRATSAFFKQEKPEYVFDAAARVGGIVANNKYRAQFIYENLMIQNNIIHQSYVNGVKKLLFLGSSCIYPKFTPQPMKEDHLLTGPLEYTNEPYAVAKIAGIKMCDAYYDQYGCNFISVMPTNLYGPNDNYDLEKSHVLPALIRKMHLGKCLENNDVDAVRKDLTKRPVEGVDGNANTERIVDVLEKFGIRKLPLANRQLSEATSASGGSSTVNITLWGTGTPKREFLYVEDLADAVVFLMMKVNAPDLHNSSSSASHINIGCGEDLSIKELAYLVKKIVGFKGELKFDVTKPDGTPRKLLDVTKLSDLGWNPNITLEEGVDTVYKAYT
ncbi:MAG: GDP-L-fucose synthase [Bacteroidales bacterium]|nr:GDP-L-fucose synthase [Bacteroidales bacterium]